MNTNAFAIELQRRWRCGILMLFSCVIFLMLPDMALAQWQNSLCRLASFSSGNLGRGLATLGVMIVAIGAILGKVTWGLAVTVAMGVTGLFFAPQIADSIVPHTECTQ